MARKPRPEPQAAEPQAASVEAQVPQPEPVKKKAVPKYRRCPICFAGYGGVGQLKWTRGVSSTLTKRCYTCDQCAFQWTIEVRREVIAMELQHFEVK